MDFSYSWFPFKFYICKSSISNLNIFPFFSRREPEDTKSQDAERDIFNEKPSKEDIIAATEASGISLLSNLSTERRIQVMFSILIYDIKKIFTV